MQTTYFCILLWTLLGTLLNVLIARLAGLTLTSSQLRSLVLTAETHHWKWFLGLPLHGSTACMNRPDNEGHHPTAHHLDTPLTIAFAWPWVPNNGRVCVTGAPQAPLQGSLLSRPWQYGAGQGNTGQARAIRGRPGAESQIAPNSLYSALLLTRAI